MFEWAATALGIVKSIPRGIQFVQQLRDVRHVAQEEIIRARDSQLDARDERLVLARETQAAQKREIERLQRELTQSFLDEKILEEVVPLMTKRAITDATDWARQYHSAVAKIELAYQIRSLRGAHPSARGTLKEPVLFALDVAVVTVQEIRRGSQQVLQLVPGDGDEQGLRLRAVCQRQIEWATSEEKRLADLIRSLRVEEVKKQS